jgi:hypothetical protein
MHQAALPSLRWGEFPQGARQLIPDGVASRSAAWCARRAHPQDFPGFQATHGIARTARPQAVAGRGNLHTTHPAHEIAALRLQ